MSETGERRFFTAAHVAAWLRSKRTPDAHALAAAVGELESFDSLAEKAFESDGDVFVTARLPGILLVSEREVSARSLRRLLDAALERVGARKVSVVLTSVEPL